MASFSANGHKRKRSNSLTSTSKTNYEHEPPHKKARKSKRIKRELTFKLNAFYKQNTDESRPKNEYVHIERLYNYSRPVWEFHRPSVCVSYEGLITNANLSMIMDDTEDDEHVVIDSFDVDERNEESEAEPEAEPEPRAERHSEKEEEEKPSILQRSFMNDSELSSLSYRDRERLSRMKLSLLYIKCCIAVLRPNSPTFPKQNELHRWLDSKNHPPLTRIDIRQARKALKEDYDILLHSNSNKLTDKYNTLHQAQEAMKHIYESAKAKCIANTDKKTCTK
eukprot:67163_1